MGVNLSKENIELLISVIVKIKKKLKSIDYIDGIYVVSLLTNNELVIELNALDAGYSNHNDNNFNNEVKSLENEINSLYSKAGFKIKIKFIKYNNLEEDCNTDQNSNYAKDIKACTILHDPNGTLKIYKKRYENTHEIKDFDNLINLDDYVYEKAN